MSCFEKIGASFPVNKTAAMVSRNGTEWKPRVSIIDYYVERPKMKYIHEQSFDSPEFKDFTGKTIGRLTILGIQDCEGRSKYKKTTWVCRCKCGYYCTRTSRAIKKILSGEIDEREVMCGKCCYASKIEKRRKRWMSRL